MNPRMFHCSREMLKKETTKFKELNSIKFGIRGQTFYQPNQRETRWKTGLYSRSYTARISNVVLSLKPNIPRYFYF